MTNYRRHQLSTTFGTRSETKETKIRVYGNSAVSTLLSFSKNIRDGEQHNVTTRNVRVWVKRQGNWKCVYFQTTRVLEPVNAQASNTAAPSYVANPANYKVIGENDLFRVILEKKPVGVRDPWHSHLDSAVYNLTDCHQMVYLPDGTTRERTLEKGSVVWQAAMTHSTENIGTSVCVMLLVERK